jgi:iron complex outermembrane recepter protein
MVVRPFAIPAVSALTLGLSAVCASAQSGSESTVIEEIVVTAQKRAESLQDVPAAISVFTGARLEALGATQLADFASYVPGLNITTGGAPGQVGLTLRGVASLEGSSTVGTYIDDSPLGSSASYARASGFQLDLFPYDIQRIEVLRGPQGTLYGASTMGGLLKYVMRAPELDRFEFRVGGEGSSIENGDGMGWAGRAGVNAPLVEGALGLRASAFYQETPGYIDNVGTGTEGENKVEQSGGRVALLWSPGERFSAQLSAMLQKIETGGIAAVDVNPATGALTFGDLSRSHLYPEPFEQTTEYYSATLTWDFDWASLVSATSFSKTETHQNSDITFLFGPFLPVFGFPPGSLAAFALELDLEKYTQEFRLASPSGGKIEWLVGAFVTGEESDNRQLGDVYDRSIDFLGRFQNAFIPTQYDEYAAFGNMTYEFTDKLDVTVGLRWAKNEQEFRQIVVGMLSAPVNLSGDSSEDVTTYMLSSRYHLSEGTMVYGRVASGYRPGGPNFSVPGFDVPPTYESDSLVNYELGVKSQFLEQRASIDVSVFYIDWQDIKITSIVGGFGTIQNGGTAESQGIEVNSAFSPVSGLQIGLNIAYTDATLTQTVPQLGPTAISGARLPEVPEWAGSATIDYEFPVAQSWTGRLGAGYRYVDERFSTFPAGATPRSRFDRYDLVDASAAIENERWTVRLFARNLLDERAYINGSGLGNYFTIIPPRTIGLSLDARF